MATRKRKCVVCELAFSASLFPSSDADICMACMSEATTNLEPLPQNQHEAATDTTTSIDNPQNLLSNLFPALEIDPANPTHQELAARFAAARSILQFIKRFRPKYLAGWVHADICRRLERFMLAVERQESPRLLLCMPVRHGKLLADSTPVLTDRGWKTHGELVKNDCVFAPDGKYTSVVAVSNTGVADVRVTFSNGASILCHENHEWTVYRRSRPAWITVPTSYWLENSPRTGVRRALKSGGRHIYQLPPVAPVEFYGRRVFSIHPYVLGAWLGDGSAGKPCITGAKSDGEIIAAIEVLGYPVSAVCEHDITGCLTTYFSGDNKHDVGLVPRRNGKIPGRMSQELMALKIFHNKRIPESYQQLLPALRLELLAGLIDTDGNVDKAGRVHIVTVSDLLRDDIMELVRSFGMNVGCHTQKPTLSSSGIQGKRPIHHISFTPTLAIPTRLPRKAIVGNKPEAVAVVSVERVPPGEAEWGRCIQVEHSSGLYLAGKHLTPTHNSEIGSRHFAPWVLGHHPDWEVIAASGGQPLAMTFSRYIRDLMRDPSYNSVFPATSLDPQSQSVENWNTTSGGGYMAAGIGTMIVGRGAHILLIDDPCTSPEAADSQLQRDSVWEWYIGAALNRLAPGGGVLGILCMTGDTPVLLPGGSEQRLDTLRVGDRVATFNRGQLAISEVRGIMSKGCDSVLKITTSSGKMVRANGRHPFLVVTNGELKWVRTRNLTIAMQIVTRQDSGGSGKGLSALLEDAKRKSSVAATAYRITSRKDGQMATDLQALAAIRDATPNSSICMALPLQTTTLSLLNSAESALSASSRQSTNQNIGEADLQSITATTQEKCAGFSATCATEESESLKLSQWHWPLQNTSDFTLDSIVSVEPDGVEEVFDLRVAHTENFIANGLVSHNTHWNEDDWAGRVIEMTKMEGPEAEFVDKFEVVLYPAINDEGDEYILADDSIQQIPPGSAPPPNAKLTRLINTPLHAERYTYRMLMNTRATYYALGNQRWWSALYQQNPSPQDGVYFTKDMMIEYTHGPKYGTYTVLQAWDFAITDKQKSDWNVGVTGLLDEYDTLFITDVWRFRTDDGIALGTAIVQYAQAHECYQVGVEDGVIWKSVKANFDKACAEAKYYPACEPIQPFTDKGARAQPLRGRMQQKKVQYYGRAPWFAILKQEFLRFLSGGKHDDQVDACAHLVRLATLRVGGKSAQRQQGKRLKSWKDALPGLMRGGKAGHMSA